MNLFTGTFLRSQVDLIKKEDLPSIQWQEFQKIDPHAEVIILFGRGSKEHFHDPVYFWLLPYQCGKECQRST